jgi:hypothetical protein
LIKTRISHTKTKLILTLSFSISVLAACLALPIAQPKYP